MITYEKPLYVVMEYKPITVSNITKKMIKNTDINAPRRKKMNPPSWIIPKKAPIVIDKPVKSMSQDGVNQLLLAIAKQQGF